MWMGWRKRELLPYCTDRESPLFQRDPRSWKSKQVDIQTPPTKSERDKRRCGTLFLLLFFSLSTFSSLCEGHPSTAASLFSHNTHGELLHINHFCLSCPPTLLHQTASMDSTNNGVSPVTENDCGDFLVGKTLFVGDLPSSIRDTDIKTLLQHCMPVE